MNLSELYRSVPGAKARKRVGRGRGSGLGKTCGRGHKGQFARAGGSVRLGFEGGQMPLFRRMPKKGFNNANFRKEFAIVNLSVLSRFAPGSEVKLEDYSGIIKDWGAGIKVLGEGEVPKNLTVTAHRFSASARQKIEAAGGKCVELAPPLPFEEQAKLKPVRRGGAKRKEKKKPAATED